MAAPPSLLLPARAAALLRDLRARFSRLGQTDRNRLLAARDLLARAAGLQGPALALVHRALDLALSLLSVLASHAFSSVLGSIVASPVPRLPPKTSRPRRLKDRWHSPCHEGVGARVMLASAGGAKRWNTCGTLKPPPGRRTASGS